MSLEEQVALANLLMRQCIKPALPTGTGAVLLVFDYNGGGHMTYISTAERESMCKALREMLAKLDEET